MIVISEDERWLVVDKPSGWLTHAQRGVKAPDCVEEARKIAGEAVHPVHRLDRGASGVLIFAKSGELAAAFQKARETGRVHRHYLVVVRGTAARETVLVDHPVPNDEDGPKVPAQSRVRGLESVERYSVVCARPITGRFHQLRRHLKHLSLPVIGDTTYGKGEHNRLWRERFGMHRLGLHAWAVQAQLDDDTRTWFAPLARDVSEPLRAAGFAGSYLNATALSAALPSFT